MLGSHERRVFFFENGTLLPYCFVFPWNRPSCDRLNGWLKAAARDGKEGNMVVSQGAAAQPGRSDGAGQRRAKKGRSEPGTHAKGHMGHIGKLARL